MNPFKAIRLQRGLTHEALAFRIGCGRLALIRTEQGCYTDPPPKILAYYLANFQDVITESELRCSYHEFQRLQRRASYVKQILKTEPLTKISTVPITVNPVTHWRLASQISKAKVSTSFCIHPAVVSKIELKPHVISGGLPEQYLTAMMQAGYPELDVAALNGKFVAYVEHLNYELGRKVKVTSSNVSTSQTIKS